MEMEIRTARREDLVDIVRMLADDPLGSRREGPLDPLPHSYEAAFEAIDDDPNHELIVGVQPDSGDVVAVLQLTFLPNLSHRGAWRAQIEGVRVHGDQRGAGLGRRLFEGSIRRARERGCRLVQLTTDRQRPEALRFYESLGFAATHHGMKLSLVESGDTAEAPQR